MPWLFILLKSTTIVLPNSGNDSARVVTMDIIARAILDPLL
jgi:hypothetical protein